MNSLRTAGNTAYPSPFIPCLAIVRALCTIVGAVMTWLTIVHFSATPFPLFYGWPFTLVSMTISVSMISGLQHTKQLAQRLWSHVCGCSCSQPAAAAGKPPAYAAAADSCCGPTTVQLQLQGCAAGSSIWCCDTAHVAVQWLTSGVKRCMALLGLLLLLLGFVFLHGGAVLADAELLLSWCKLRKATTRADQQRQQQRLQAARHAAAQSSVNLALVFVMPSVVVKCALMVMTLDFSAIPVVSVAFSTVSATVVSTMFISSTYVYCPVWTVKQRLLGVAYVALSVLGMFLGRAAAVCWLVLKFGGEVEAIWLWLCHTMIMSCTLLVGTSSRLAFLQCYAEDRLATLLYVCMGAAHLIIDVPAFIAGLKSPETRNKPSWLLNIFFSRSSLALFGCRIVEGVVCYVLVAVTHLIPPCIWDPVHISSFYMLCAEVASHRFFWRPRCWGCSTYDLLTLDGRTVWLLVVMIGAGGVLLLLSIVGLVGTHHLLCQHVPHAPDPQVARQSHGGPAANLPARPALDSTAAASSTLVTVTASDVEAAAVAPCGPDASTRPAIWAAQLSPLGQLPFEPLPSYCTGWMQPALRFPADWCSLMYPTTNHITVADSRDRLPKLVYDTTSLVPPCPIAPVAATSLTPSGSSACIVCDDRPAPGLGLELCCMIGSCALADFLVFNLHWSVQAAMLPAGFLCLVWMHLGCIYGSPVDS